MYVVSFLFFSTTTNMSAMISFRLNKQELAQLQKCLPVPSGTHAKALLFNTPALTEALQQRKKENEQLKKENQQLQETITKTTLQLNKAETENKALTQKLDKLESSLLQCRSTEQMLRGRIRDLQSRGIFPHQSTMAYIALSSSGKRKREWEGKKQMSLLLEAWQKLIPCVGDLFTEKQLLRLYRHTMKLPSRICYWISLPRE